ncbi:MAG: arabinan endo-1,5-alpha-L-arabinosidase [Comamonadaceae bacterium]|jgi:arabinan endo-1,5-alpha-L-arabinosidase|nr:arabinan endo-1,5-alpha-L-arabinosidase [Comamonadaceae bacterium]
MRAMRLLWALAAMLALLPCARADAAEPQAQPGAHDPTLLIQGERWFVFTTGPGLPRLESTDQGQTWRRLPPVFSAAPAWWLEAVPGHRGLDVWAPKLFRHRGRSWVLYAISSFGKNRSAIGLASSDGPDGSDWRDEGLVVQSRAEDDFNAIDPDLFVDDDGRLWLSYGSFWGGLRLTELDADTLRPIGETRFIARRKGGIEAPTLVRHGDWVYLFASYGLCCKGVDSSYDIRVGRARSVTGPYLDRDGRDLMDGGATPLLAGGTRWKGPGHQDVAGGWLVHHAYDSQHGGRPRLRLKRLDWSADGWPSVPQED